MRAPGRGAPARALIVAAAAAAGPAAARAAPAPRLGAMADVGVPDGATASLVVRPWRALRLHAGGGYNGIRAGARAGATLTPLPTWISPTLSLDGGRFREGDANPLARRITGDPTLHSAALERVGYTFTSAQLGLALGQRWATLYVQVGVSRVTGALHHLDTVARSGGASWSLTLSEDPRAVVWSISARLGLVVYLWK